MKVIKKNLKWIVAGLMLVLGMAGASVVYGQPHVVTASHVDKYGRQGKYTVPKGMRGTWVSRSKKSAYKTIKLTAHTATFVAKSSFYKKLDGKWTLYNMNNHWYDKHFETDWGGKASTKSIKSHWLATRNQGKKGTVFFKFGWTFDDARSFTLRKAASNTIRFDNPSFQNNYYRK